MSHDVHVTAGVHEQRRQDFVAKLIGAIGRVLEA